MAVSPPSLSSRIGLNAFNFFTAGVQTGFGPFLAVYLTRAGWDQGAVGLALSIGTIAGVASQVPGGALVDHIHHKRLACAGSLGAVGLSALILALWPGLVPVWGAQILHALGSAVLTPAIAAMTLTLSGHSEFGERLGGNARYASLGNAAAAAALGAVAFHMSHRAVFFLTAAITLPALAALLLIQPCSIEPGYRRTPGAAAPARAPGAALARVLRAASAHLRFVRRAVFPCQRGDAASGAERAG